MYKNLVLEGGGIKGLGHLGAFQALEEKDLLRSIKSVAGTSVGAIMGLCVALGYTYEEINKIVLGINWNKIGSKETHKKIWYAIRFFFLKGFHSGEYLKEVIEDTIERKTGSKETTFEELANLIKEGKEGFKYFYCNGTNISTGESEVFSHEKTPDMKISEATMISSAAPIYFSPHLYNDCLYSDGMLLENYMISLFDKKSENNDSNHHEYIPNYETLGIILDEGEPEKLNITSFIIPGTYLKRMIGIFCGATDNAIQHIPYNNKRSVRVEAKGNPLDFGMSEKEKQELISNGYKATAAYLEKNKDKWAE